MGGAFDTIIRGAEAVATPLGDFFERRNQRGWQNLQAEQKMRQQRQQGLSERKMREALQMIYAAAHSDEPVEALREVQTMLPPGLPGEVYEKASELTRQIEEHRADLGLTEARRGHEEVRTDTERERLRSMRDERQGAGRPIEYPQEYSRLDPERQDRLEDRARKLYDQYYVVEDQTMGGKALRPDAPDFWDEFFPSYLHRKLPSEVASRYSRQLRGAEGDIAYPRMPPTVDPGGGKDRIDVMGGGEQQQQDKDDEGSGFFDLVDVAARALGRAGDWLSGGGEKPSAPKTAPSRTPQTRSGAGGQDGGQQGSGQGGQPKRAPQRRITGAAGEDRGRTGGRAGAAQQTEQRDLEQRALTEVQQNPEEYARRLMEAASEMGVTPTVLLADFPPEVRALILPYIQVMGAQEAQ